MHNLYLDIETIPAQSPELRDAIAANIKPPATMKKADTIAAWEENDKPKAIEEAIARTSFDGAYGHICCIGFALDESEPDHSYSATPEDEARALRNFFAAVDQRIDNSFRTACIVGHNVVNFDIRFIWKRAIILGVRVPRWFPRDPKPWSNEVFDTMTAFAGQRDTIGLDRLCQILNIPGKGDVDGSQVAQMWAEGRHDEIARYCIDDVERTRRVHRRMMYAFGEAA